MGVRRGGLAALAVLGAVAVRAHADVDWATGMVTARGVGVANRAAPNPATARGPARRLADDAARRELATLVAALPVAGGGTVGEQTAAVVKARVARAIADALPVAADPQTDGSWIVVMGVPTEAVRQAIVGPRSVTLGAPDAGPPVVIVEGATVAPAVGYTFGTTSAASLWVKAAPAWAKGAPKVKATGVQGAAIALAAPTGDGATLYLVIRP